MRLVTAQEAFAHDTVFSNPISGVHMRMSKAKAQRHMGATSCALLAPETRLSSKHAQPLQSLKTRRRLS